MGDYGVIGAWILLAVIVIGAVLVAVGSVLLGNRFHPDEIGLEYNSALSPYLTVVGLIYGALLGFTVVVGWQESLSAEVNVSNEASTLTTMYRQTVAMPEPAQSQIRQQLRNYAEGVQSPEWGKQGFDHVSQRARAAITEMYRIVGSEQSSGLKGEISQAFLSQLTELASDLATRVLDAKPRIPLLLWVSLIFGGLVLIALTGLLRLTGNLGHIVLTSAVAVLLALLLFLVFVLDHPFGPLGVTTQPFAHAITVFDSVDQGS